MQDEAPPPPQISTEQSFSFRAAGTGQASILLCYESAGLSVAMWCSIADILHFFKKS